ncbi:hypothetical protein [Lactobacillus delbrueckii]|uniref:hypothetical protein n=1 Tax=Lactobacillus delbrueckii TaxID=1584 RepID=UPI0004A5C979|nr:hypothetical protein [Lactobacillus delbrueckii]MCD5466057.1 hypothetical protein [Lactobacillus delbrueckii subsp. bulgaricus]MCT3467378.1 hypothetical protein [Lactobacillus delbrueckii subsp. bulgaricus]CDR76162.1 Hypothetical protein LBVIB44_10180 [Lactobacillus delbrueckii subsp. bulgaricus]
MQFTKQFEGTFVQVKEQIDKFVAEGGHIDSVITDHTSEKVTENHTFSYKMRVIAICSEEES